MEWVETTARTVEEAKELALDQLGVHMSEAEFEVLEEPKSGLFGRTRGNARVRARVVPLTPAPKNERRRRPKKAGEDERPSRGGASKGADGPKDSTAGKADDSSQAAKAAESSGRGARSQPASKEQKPNRSSRSGQAAAKKENREMMDMTEQQQVLESFLVELAASFGLEATASSSVEENELTVNLSGAGLGLLVGPRLATLDSVQEIARNALQRQAAGREYAKVVVDVEGIRGKRRDSLTAFVVDAARQVRDDEVEVVFEVMSSADRKLVHDVASDQDGVVSASEGEDPRRRVVLRRA